uniref:Uncharacterized protein n=1 Tax=Rhizophora mucronata TaxID=61149 RepID=A0A2P2PHW0_RHIMU
MTITWNMLENGKCARPVRGLHFWHVLPLPTSAVAISKKIYC